MMDNRTVLCDIEDAVAIVRLNRPEKHNAINRQMQVELASTFQALESDDSVRAIVISGAGDKAFCAGADMSERASRMENGTPPTDAIQRIDGVAAVARCSKPVIAAINGYAYGGGARLALNADIRLASSTAKIRFVGASYGLVVCGATLPLLVGPARAKELIFTARVVEALEAERIGLVNQVVESAQLMPAALEMAQQIAANSADAVRWAKRVIELAVFTEQAAEMELEANRELSASREHNERFLDASNRITGKSS